ncbi:MAG TPA: DUF29 family protein [Reyranella sp.]|jgi:hypothetical protein|nr:DUF29 family protein [Reyranella sp.]
MSDLYDEDILLWSERQGTLLRRIAAGEPVNERPDWANIIEEVESVGREQLHAVESLLLQALLHMLKAEGWPNARDVENWLADARGFRVQARRRFAPSMRQKIDLAGIYADALSALPTRMDDQPAQPLSPTCPMTLDELLGI